MRTITTLLLLALLTSCSSSCGGNTPHVNWPSVVQCGEPIAGDLFGTVTGILATPPDAGDASSIGDRAVQSLEQLAVAHGPEVIACLVNQAIASFDHVAAPSAAASTTERANASRVAAEQTGARVAAARGRDFLQRVAKTRVEGSEQ